jgi:DDB1- and CUL4-associated factor 7
MNANSPRSASSRLNSPRPDVKKKYVNEPAFAYTAPSQVTNLAWSPVMQGISMGAAGQLTGGEWVAIACGKSVKALKV